MLPSLFRWWWEFFHSILGDSAFAKLLAGFLAIIAVPVAIGAVLAVAGLVFGTFSQKQEEFRRSGKAFALQMRVRQFIRDLFKR